MRCGRMATICAKIFWTKLPRIQCKNVRNEEFTITTRNITTHSWCDTWKRKLWHSNTKIVLCCWLWICYGLLVWYMVASMILVWIVWIVWWSSDNWSLWHDFWHLWRELLWQQTFRAWWCSRRYVVTCAGLYWWWTQLSDMRLCEWRRSHRTNCCHHWWCSVLYCATLSKRVRNKLVTNVATVVIWYL